MPSNQIWYYAPSEVNLNTTAGVVSHTFSDGKGVLTFENDVTTVYQWLRETEITNVKLPYTVTNIIEQEAFYDCEMLSMIDLPSALTIIGHNAFSNCTRLSMTEFPAGVTRIMEYAFSSCACINSITFNGTPTYIDSTSFVHCSNLLDIYVPWSEGTVAGAPWGATNATIHYNHTPSSS